MLPAQLLTLDYSFIRLPIWYFRLFDIFGMPENLIIFDTPVISVNRKISPAYIYLANQIR